MKKKIVFWFGVEFTHFCLANIIQKKFDADYYSVVDITTNPRTFFENQTLTSFKKTWYFFDHVKKQENKIDFEYLKEFEKKYEINLWNLAINERIFYRFNEFYKFTDYEIYSILEQECKLFEKILDEVKPDYLLTKDASRHHHHLFTEMCKKRGTRILMLSRTNLGNKVLISEKSHQFDLEFNSSSTEQSKYKNFEDLRKYLDSFKFSKYLNEYNTPTTPKQKLDAGLKYIFSDSKNNQNQYYYYGRKKSSVLLNTITTSLKTKIRKNFLEKNSVKVPILKDTFAYFPLHVDMERPLLIEAPFYTNQIEIIRHIVKSLPAGMKLFVKESPAGNTRSWRTIDDYKQILNIPNVTLIHPSVPAKNLFENCSLVFTVAGTSGFEASFYEKPTIVFSDVAYVKMPSVFRVDQLEKLPKLIKTALNTKVSLNDVSNFLEYIEQNTMEFDWFGFQKSFYKKFYFDGTLHDTIINESDVEKFIHSHMTELEPLAEYHVEKINSVK
jgi:hypothetical protein